MHSQHFSCCNALMHDHLHGTMHFICGEAEWSTCMQGNRIAIIIGVCVGGIAVVVMAVAVGARRKIRADEYAFSVPGGTTAHYSSYSNPMTGNTPNAVETIDTRDLSDGGSSMHASSPASSAHNSPRGEDAFCETTSPRSARGSAAGGKYKPETVAVGTGNLLSDSGEQRGK
jgi:hypothetical protein